MGRLTFRHKRKQENITKQKDTVAKATKPSTRKVKKADVNKD